mgnify:CR=1 FL=1
MTLAEYVRHFIRVEVGLPEEDGWYDVVVKTKSIYEGGTFLTQMLFQEGSWVPKDGYCEMHVLSWASNHDEM